MMRTPLRALRQCAREAWEGLHRNASLSLLAAVAIGIALYIGGLFLLVRFNLERFVRALGSDLQVQIYLADDATAETVERLKNEVLSDPAVEGVATVSRDQARQRFEATFPALRDLARQIGGAPFPASIDVTLRPAYRTVEAIDLLVKSYRKAPGVADIRFDLGWLQRLSGIVALVERGGFAVGALLALAALVSVGATVRLTVLARREEIEIMKLVGATAAFIRAPFLLAAAVQGLLGGALAAGALLLTFRLVVRSEFYRANPFLSIVVGRLPPAPHLAALAAAGALLGLVAAALSLRRAGTF